MFRGHTLKKTQQRSMTIFKVTIINPLCSNVLNFTQCLFNNYIFGVGGKKYSEEQITVSCSSHTRSFKHKTEQRNANGKSRARRRPF